QAGAAEDDDDRDQCRDRVTPDPAVQEDAREQQACETGRSGGESEDGGAEVPGVHPVQTPDTVRSKGFARASESVSPRSPDAALGPEGTDRRPPQRPERRGGSGRGGPPPLASRTRLPRARAPPRAPERAVRPPPPAIRGRAGPSGPGTPFLTSG